MKSLLLGLAFAAGLSAPLLARDEEPSARPEAGASRAVDPAYRVHRRRAYDARREESPYAEGVTCVTPKLVCWVPRSLGAGAPCTCETRRFGTLSGEVGG